MKLIKINTDHYVIVDDSEIKEGDYWCNIHSNSYYIDTKAPEASGRFAMNSNAIFINPKKITHSTQPLEEGTTIHGIEHKRWNHVKFIDLSEVKELIGEVDVEKKALSQYSSEEDDYEDGWYVGYIRGYNQALEDNKDKKYTEEDVRRAFYNGGNMKEIEEFNSFIQSLQPKTEWEVEFVDGKLKLKDDNTSN